MALHLDSVVSPGVVVAVVASVVPVGVVASVAATLAAAMGDESKGCRRRERGGQGVGEASGGKTGRE